ncbi:MAG: hypothetical protein ACTHMG_00840 [Sphingomonas sp.]
MPTPPRPIEATARSLCVLACAAGLLIGTGASARDDAPRNADGWTVEASSDGDGCFLTKVYKHVGDTTVLLGLDRDGGNHLSVLNANWSIKPKERLKLTFRLSKGAYTDHFAIGMASDGKQGFVTSFEAKFPAYFASSRMLDIDRGDVPVERLNLDGSGAAVAALRRCVATQRKKPAAAAKKPRHSDIPRDPFARN